MASNYSELFYVAALDIKSWTTNEARSVWLHGYIFILYQESLIRIMVCLMLQDQQFFQADFIPV